MTEETLLDVFEGTSEEGKLDMFEEAVDNIHQLEAIIAEKKSEISELHASLIERDQEIVAFQDRVSEFETFVNEFLENFEDCDNCGGGGYDKQLDDMCRDCHGEGHTLVSRGVLYNELFHKAISLIGKVPA